MGGADKRIQEEVVLTVLVSKCRVNKTKRDSGGGCLNVSHSPTTCLGLTLDSLTLDTLSGL
jgi:hypothetical protein